MENWNIIILIDTGVMGFKDGFILDEIINSE
jgi:hypothetical protein